MYRGNDILKIYDQDLNNIGRATREEVHTKACFIRLPMYGCSSQRKMILIS